MLLAAGLLMFNVACTEDGIDGLPGGFGSGQDTAEMDDKDKDKKEKKEKKDKDGGFVIPVDNDIWQGENSFREEDGE